MTPLGARAAAMVDRDYAGPRPDPFRRTPRTTHIASAVLWCLFLPACAATSDRGEADIDALPMLGVNEDRRIGSRDDPETGFSRLGRSFDVDADGNVYALEVQDREIRVYDAGGNVVRRIGRRGGGPGEFENSPGFGIVGDTLWAYDSEAGRITLFDRAGNVLSTGPTHGLRIPLASGFGYVLPERMRPDGLFTGWLSRISYSRDDPPSGIDESDPIRVPHVLFDATGAVVDTIGWMPAPPPRMVPPPDFDNGPPVRITVGSQSYFVPRAPPELPRWLPLVDGRIVVDVPNATDASAGRFTVTRIGLDSDTVYHRVLMYRPEPYTDEQLDSVAARNNQPYVSGGPIPEGPAPEVVNAIRAALDFPEYRQPVGNAWVGQDGSVWLLRHDEPGGMSRWIVLDPDGAPRGGVNLPPRSRPLWQRADTLWVSEPDEYDVPWLVRYTIAG